MSLRKKTTYIIIFIFISLIILLYAVSREILGSGFLQLENQYMTKSVSQAVYALQEDVNGLDTKIGDWSSWDDTYSFIDDGNDSYIQSNLNNTTFTQLSINTIAFIDSSKKLLFSGDFDLKDKNLRELPENFKNFILSDSFTGNFQKEDYSLSGILSTSRGPSLIIAKPILHSDGSGPGKGILIMGRYLDDSEVEKLSHTTNLSINLKELKDNNLPEDYKQAYENLKKGSDSFIKPLSKDETAGYALIKDIEGNPLLIMRVTDERQIYHQGKSTLRFIALSLCVVGIIVGILVLLIMEKLVLSPLRILSRTVKKIGESGDLSIRIPVKESDELGTLAEAANKMLDELSVYQEQLKHSRDAAETANIAKSAFLANMSHEIRTPMNAIVGMTELLLNSPLNNEQKELTSSVQDAGNLLLSIINDILDFSKIEANKFTLNNAKFNLVSEVESVAEIMAVKAQEKKLSLMTYIAPAIPQVSGDGDRLRQVLLNLISNAIKFTDQGEIIVMASLSRKGTRDITVAFEVSDTGIGIDEEQQSRLFQPFVQADNSSTRRYGGTGLGLSISKHIIELMNGKISLKSSPGKGTTFRFTATFEKINENVNLTGTQNLKAVRILVASESNISSDIIVNYLSAWGIDNTRLVMSAEQSIENCLKEIDSSSYDLIILDLLSEPRDVHCLLPEKIKAKTVLMAACNRALYSEKVIDSGFSAFLTKPVKQSQLFDCIVTVINNASAYTEAACASDPAVTPPKSMRTPKAPCEGDKILLAEDNPINRKLALLQLQRLGVSVDIAVNGKEAVDQVETGRYSMVLMDCQMPEMDGFEATKAIRKLQATQNRHITIVAITANAMEGDREKCLAAGMDDYISKPIRLQNLLEIFKRWKVNHTPPAE